MICSICSNQHIPGEVCQDYLELKAKLAQLEALVTSTHAIPPEIQTVQEDLSYLRRQLHIDRWDLIRDGMVISLCQQCDANDELREFLQTCLGPDVHINVDYTDLHDHEEPIIPVCFVHRLRNTLLLPHSTRLHHRIEEGQLAIHDAGDRTVMNVMGKEVRFHRREQTPYVQGRGTPVPGTPFMEPGTRAGPDGT